MLHGGFCLSWVVTECISVVTDGFEVVSIAVAFVLYPVFTLFGSTESGSFFIDTWTVVPSKNIRSLYFLLVAFRIIYVEI